MKTSVPSNTFVGFGSFGLAFVVGLYTYHLEATRPRLAISLGIAAFSLGIFGIAAAQLRSGYTWQNLAPGNRGLHRSVAPAQFWRSVIWHFVLGLLVLGLAVWRYFAPW